MSIDKKLDKKNDNFHYYLGQAVATHNLNTVIKGLAKKRNLSLNKSDYDFYNNLINALIFKAPKKKVMIDL